MTSKHLCYPSHLKIPLGDNQRPERNKRGKDRNQLCLWLHHLMWTSGQFGTLKDYSLIHLLILEMGTMTSFSSSHRAGYDQSQASSPPRSRSTHYYLLRKLLGVASGTVSPENSCPPRTFGSDLIGNRVFADVIMVRMEMRSHWAPNPMKSVPLLEKEKNTNTEKTIVCKRKQTLQWCARLQVRESKDCWQLTEAGREVWRFFQSSRRNQLCLVSDSDPQNCDRIHLCCFKPPGLWKFVMLAQGN